MSLGKTAFAKYNKYIPSFFVTIIEYFPHFLYTIIEEGE